MDDQTRWSRTVEPGASVLDNEVTEQMYIGPETLMPLASALAAVTGVLLMFWRKVVGFFRATVQFIGSKTSRR